MSKDLSRETLDDGLKGYVSLTEKIVFVSADNGDAWTDIK